MLCAHAEPPASAEGEQQEGVQGPGQTAKVAKTDRTQTEVSTQPGCALWWPTLLTLHPCLYSANHTC